MRNHETIHTAQMLYCLVGGFTTGLLVRWVEFTQKNTSLYFWHESMRRTLVVVLAFKFATYTAVVRGFGQRVL